MVLALAIQPAVASTPALSLAGVVRDSVGTVLGEVEILLVEPTGAATRAVAHSDAAGEFHFDGLSPAVYRIAALKDGYLTFIATVDPQLERWVQVVLHPAPRPGVDEVPTTIPTTDSWALRRARRYVLHERDPQATFAAADDDPMSSAIEDALVMQVDQLFPVAARPSTNASSEPEVRGSETRLRVASPMGDRASIDVEGYRRLTDSTGRDASAAAAATHDASRLALAFSYDTGTEGQLDVNAFYNQGGVEYSSRPVAPEGAGNREAFERRDHRQWGYDARWSTQLQDMGTVAVQLDYHHTALSGPTGVPTAALPAIEPGADQLQAQTVGARGSFTAVPLDDHALEVDVHAQRLDATDPAAPALGAALVALSGMSLGLNVQDTWSVGGPFAVIYGLGYRHALGTRDASLVVPRLGGEWRVDRLAVRGVVSYHGVTDWSELERALHAAPPESAMGYEAEVELPLACGLRLAAATAHAPIQFDLAGYSGGFSHDARPLYLTDGNAASRERRLALIRDGSRLRFYLEWQEGTVAGTLATITPDEGPRGFLVPGDLDHHTGRMGIRIFPSGTDLLFQFQSLLQTAGDPTLAESSSQRSYEVRLSQELLDLDPLGSWRVIVALRRATLRSDGADDPLRALQTEVVEPLNHQLSAGLSVTF
jgi:hypothetical protein